MGCRQFQLSMALFPPLLSPASENPRLCGARQIGWQNTGQDLKAILPVSLMML